MWTNTLDRQLCRATAPKVLCKPEGGPEDVGPGDDSHNVDDDEERDPETFDDAELYQQLLKEFLESSAGAGAHTSGVLKVRSVPQTLASEKQAICYSNPCFIQE